MRLLRPSRRIDEDTIALARSRVAQLGYVAMPDRPVADRRAVPGHVARHARRPPAGDEPASPTDPTTEVRYAEPAGATLVDRLLAPLRRARVGLERRHMVVLGLTLALGVCGAVGVLVLGRPVITPVEHEIVASGTPVPVPEGSSAAPHESEPADHEHGAAPAMLVHVAGLVVRPGVVELPAGARVVDAIEAAGGARPEADLTPLNLAKILNDGEQVLVSAEPAASSVGSGDGGTSPSGGTSESGGGTNPSGQSATVRLNTATAEDLDTLPGIGPTLAAKILDWRAANGRFTSIDELREIPGIGDRRFAEIEPLVSL